MYKKGKNQKGITLIALIITIIVMLILVGVSISMSVNGGLFEKAGEAVGKTNNALIAEHQLAEGGITVGDRYYASIDDYVKGPTADNLFGVWVFIDDFDNDFPWADELYYDVSFKSNNRYFVAFDDAGLGMGCLGYCTASGGTTAVFDAFHEGWTSDVYKTVDFGTDGQKVTEDFFVWLTENATYQK